MENKNAKDKESIKYRASASENIKKLISDQLYRP